jgi:hypothetical protein
MEWPDTIASQSPTDGRYVERTEPPGKRSYEHERTQRHLPPLALPKRAIGLSPRPLSAINRTITIGSLDHLADHTHPRLATLEEKRRSRSIGALARDSDDTSSLNIKRHKSEDGLNWRQSRFTEETIPISIESNTLNDVPSREIRQATVITLKPAIVDTTSPIDSTGRSGTRRSLETRVEDLEKKMIEMERALERAQSRSSSVKNITSRPTSIRTVPEKDVASKNSQYSLRKTSPRHSERPVLSPLSFRNQQPHSVSENAIDSQSNSPVLMEYSAAKEKKVRSFSTSTTIRTYPDKRWRSGSNEQSEPGSLSSLQYNGLLNMLREEQSQRKRLEQQVVALLKQLEYLQRTSIAHSLPTPQDMHSPRRFNFSNYHSRHTSNDKPAELFSTFDSFGQPVQSTFSTDDILEDHLPGSAFETSSVDIGALDTADESDYSFGNFAADQTDNDEDDDADDNKTEPDPIHRSEVIEELKIAEPIPTRTMSLSQLTQGRLGEEGLF